MEKHANPCTTCHQPIDNEWPGILGPICQMCWEGECSDAWWAAYNGIVLAEQEARNAS